MDKKIFNIGIIGTADIAYRRFLPALKKHLFFNYIGVASRNINNTNKFIDLYGGKGYGSYDDIINDKNIDVVYIPLPPALHYEWGKKALLNNKHVFMEKPFCTCKEHTKELCEIAKSRNLIIYENYMFLHHRQLEFIKKLINEKLIGEIRLIRIAFGFPFRGNNDFRYNKSLGGGALLDCGGYVIKLASYLLGEDCELKYSKLNYGKYTVDTYGNAIFENKDGLTAQVAFGMDNAYKCELEIWGERGTILAPRIFTAPPDLDIKICLNDNEGSQEFYLERDDQFFNSIDYFYKMLNDRNSIISEINSIIYQSRYVELIGREKI